MSDVALGVDLSDVIARLAVVAGGKVVERGIVAPRRDSAIKDAAQKALHSAGVKAAAVGIAMPGVADSAPGDIGVALKSATSPGTRVGTVPAGTAAAIAEQRLGAAQDVRQVIAFSIAEHVTAGVLIDGKPWTGAHGLGSSVGWMALNPVEREDYRRFGGLEAEVSSAGIVRRFVWRVKSGDHSAVAKQARGDLSKLAAADILQGARAGDGVSIAVVRDTAKYIGMAIANLTTLFDPEMIVLGGIIASSGDVMFESIKVEAARRLMPQQNEQIRIVLSTLGDDAVAIGAALAMARE
jgi:predicted NBD/HSP70 family sugar kinase